MRVRVKDSVGAFGEEVAVGYLVEAGYTVIERNWRCDAGEIDIIGRDRNRVVVIEVKTRRGFDFGSGLEAVTPAKGTRLRRLAMRYVESTGETDRPPRIDVVAVHLVAGDVRIEHVRGAF